MTSNYLQISELSSVIGNISSQGVYKLLKTKNLESILISARKKVVPPSSIRKILLDKGFKYKKQILSFDMIKGGVGKTTLSSNVGMRASHYECRTLLIDFDLQGNLSRSFNIDIDKDSKVWIDILKDNVAVKDTIIKIDNFLDIIPSNLNNSRLDIEMQHASINIKDHVHDILESVINDYELIIIDCPPAINKVSASAICASDTIIIPLNPDPYAMDGLEMTLNEIKRIKTNFKINRPNHLVVWNKYDARKRLGAIYMNELAKQIPTKNILPVVIRTDTNYQNSIANTGSIFENTKNSVAKEDIDQMTRELIGITSWVEDNFTD
jgi:chromosome partitioning protein